MTTFYAKDQTVTDLSGNSRAQTLDACEESVSWEEITFTDSNPPFSDFVNWNQGNTTQVIEDSCDIAFCENLSIEDNIFCSCTSKNPEAMETQLSTNIFDNNFCNLDEGTYDFETEAKILNNSEQTTAQNIKNEMNEETDIFESLDNPITYSPDSSSILSPNPLTNPNLNPSPSSDTHRKNDLCLSELSQIRISKRK